MVGKGTYGAVISANNVQTKEQVAIKKLTHIEDVVSPHKLPIFCLRLTLKEF